MTLIIDSTYGSFRQIFDDSIFSKTRLEISSHFHVLQYIDRLNLKELLIKGDNYWDTIDLSIVKWCSSLESLEISGSLMHGEGQFYDYIKSTNLKKLSIRITDFDIMRILEILYQNTTIKHLYLHGKLELYRNSDIKIPNLLKNTNLVSLGAHPTLLSEIHKYHNNAFTHNTTLTNLILYNKYPPPIEIVYNISIISCKYDDSEYRQYQHIFDQWTDMNKSLRWKSQHGLILDTYLALQPRYNPLPPYVFLEIFDWMIDSNIKLCYNPFVSHRQKIHLIMSIRRSIRLMNDELD